VSIGVLKPGPLTTVQDRGRPGYADLGVPTSGALDQPALERANALVGNSREAAGLECTLHGPTLRFARATTIALTGAPSSASLNGAPLPHDTAHAVTVGDELVVGPATSGVRTYLAVAGGIDAPATLGSRSTDTLSGLGPAPLAAGDVLHIGSAASGTGACVPVGGAPHGDIVQVVLGPRDDWFTPAALTVLAEAEFTVSPSSNRIGLRLSGPELVSAETKELRSEGLVLGAIQVPPNGQPIVMLADHPTTGGYPVIGVVAAADLAAAAQLRPGAQLRFRVIA